jgi:hypothetical protein
VKTRIVSPAATWLKPRALIIQRAMNPSPKASSPTAASSDNPVAILIHGSDMRRISSMRPCSSNSTAAGNMTDPMPTMISVK